jgi:hypothetical protein
MIQTVLAKKLHGYLLQNHPDLLLSLQADNAVTAYLNQRLDALGSLSETLLAEGKPQYIVEEICMDELTRDLRPSRFNYLCSILREECEEQYYAWLDYGMLAYEVTNLIQDCAATFEQFGFSEANEEDLLLRSAISVKVRTYIDGNL